MQVFKITGKLHFESLVIPVSMLYRVEAIYYYKRNTIDNLFTISLQV